MIVIHINEKMRSCSRIVQFSLRLNKVIQSNHIRLTCKRYLGTNKDDEGNLRSKWKTDIYTIPNMITASRILASPFLTYAIINDMKVAALTGCVVFGFTDWLDGFLAKKLNQRTVLGAYLDPAADKCMITALTIGLMYKDFIPLPVAALILGRDAALIACSVYLRLRDKPKDQAFFDVENTTFVITPSVLSKINTGMQFLLLGSTLSHYAFAFPALAQLEPLWWGTAGTTMLSGLGYLDGSGLKFFRRPQSSTPTPPSPSSPSPAESKAVDARQTDGLKQEPEKKECNDRPK